jgi:hypothetical protein
LRVKKAEKKLKKILRKKYAKSDVKKTQHDPGWVSLSARSAFTVCAIFTAPWRY